ncbi:MAG: biotin--[acetyl-CoA-carboxylase] ligase [Oscillospiraceae bacterium]|nr:biotin--[acetyl-CoA-carboxylase] ligase [Oscillospiraceae bacterium]
MHEQQRIAAAAALPPSLVRWQDSIDSTSRQLYQAAAREDLPHGTLLAAGQQSAGRGRGGKSFFSPPEAGLYFSILLRHFPAGENLAITPRAALAVHRVLARRGCALGIKWVNDLFREGRKAGGILTQILPSGAAVVGIGLNLAPVPLPAELREIVGFCFGDARCLERRPELIGEIAAALLSLMEPPATDNKNNNEMLCDEYRAASVLLGKAVTFEENGQRREALAVDITPAGGLVVLLAGEQRVLTSGEVHLRLK